MNIRFFDVDGNEMNGNEVNDNRRNQMVIMMNTFMNNIAVSHTKQPKKEYVHTLLPDFPTILNFYARNKNSNLTVYYDKLDYVESPMNAFNKALLTNNINLIAYLCCSRLCIGFNFNYVLKTTNEILKCIIDHTRCSCILKNYYKLLIKCLELKKWDFVKTLKEGFYSKNQVYKNEIYYNCLIDVIKNRDLKILKMMNNCTDVSFDYVFNDLIVKLYSEEAPQSAIDFIIDNIHTFKKRMYLIKYKNIILYVKI